MEFQAPPDLDPFEVLFDTSEPNPALPPGLLRFAGNLGFPPPPPERPWVYANFAQSLDGMVTFGGKRSGGQWIAQSRHDRWMMDLLRAQADAVLYGAGSLIQETLSLGVPGGPVFRITDPELLRLRRERLGRGKQRNILVTGSGNLRLADYRLFRSELVETMVATTPQGPPKPGRNRRDAGFSLRLWKLSGPGRAVALAAERARCAVLAVRGRPHPLRTHGSRRMGGRKVPDHRSAGGRSRHSLRSRRDRAG